MQRPKISRKQIRERLAVLAITWAFMTFCLGLAGGGYAFLISLVVSFVAFAVGVVIQKYEVVK
jgi:hypothetical protein